MVQADHVSDIMVFRILQGDHDGMAHSSGVD